jgi:hypothetical protein
MGFFFDAVANSDSRAYVDSATFVVNGLNGLWDPAAPNGYSNGILNDISGHPQAPGHKMYLSSLAAIVNNRDLKYNNGIAYIDIDQNYQPIGAPSGNVINASYATINGYAYGTSDTFYLVTRKNLTWEFWIQRRSSGGDFFSNNNVGIRIRFNNTSIESAYVIGMITNSWNVGNVTANTWCQIAFTMEDLGANDSYKIYFNGSLVNTWSTGNYNPTNTTAYGSLQQLFTWNTLSSFSSAWLGLARSYSRVLTASEISTNWNNTKSRFGL